MAYLTAPQRNAKIVYLRSQGGNGLLAMSPEQLRLELLSGAGVPTCSPPNTVNVSDSVVLHLTAGYFNGGLAELASDRYLWRSDRMRSELETAWKALRGHSAREQLDRIAQARKMLLACEDSERVLDVLVAT